MRLLLDEMIPPVVVEKLREAGHDVLSVQERGTRSSGDPAQLEDASRMGRAIVTYNIDDFVGLVTEYAETGRSHYGVILVSQYSIRQGDRGTLIRALTGLCERFNSDGALVDQCIYLESV